MFATSLATATYAAPGGAIVAASSQAVPGTATETGLTPPDIDLRIVIQTTAMPPRTDSAYCAGGGFPVVIEDANGSTGQAVTLPGPHVIGRQNMDVSGDPELRIITIADAG